jgi:hypothetical protein
MLLAFHSFGGPWQSQMCLLYQASQWLHDKAPICGSKMNNEKKCVHSFQHSQIKSHWESGARVKNPRDQFLFSLFS